MVDYRTRMFDGQIGFGSGSKVNADDIPATATRFWLTNAAQEISGSKIFGDDLDASFNNIIHLADPANDRDAVNKSYVDTTSGSIGVDLNHQVLELYGYVDDNTGANTSATLDDVCDNGSTTDQNITAGNILVNANVYINYDGAEGNSSLYFYEDGSSTGASLQWVNVPGHFTFDQPLNMGNNRILGVTDPTSNQDAATKKYVDDKSPLTTKGDIWVHSNTDTRLPIGTDGQRLIVDSSESLGLKWGGVINVETSKFDTTTQTEIVAASGSSVINIVGFSCHNNDSTGANDTRVQLTDGSGSDYLYGGADGSIYLPGRGGVFVLPPSAEFPYFSGSAGNGIYLEPVAGKRVAGNIWYTRD